jgi:cytochrome P450
MRLAQSHRAHPVVYDPRSNSWFVHGYDDVRRLLVDERLSADRMHRLAERAPAAVDAVRRRAPWLLSAPGDDYDWIGPIVRAGLRGANDPAWRALINETADELLDELLQRDRLEIVSDYALALSGAMAAELLGAAHSDGQRLIGWGLDLVTFFNDVDVTAQGAEQMARSATAAVDYARRVLSDDGAAASHGFLSLVARAAAHEGRRLDQASVASVTLPVLTGHVDAAHLIATTVWLLLSHDDQRAKLLDDPRLWGGAIAETLRFGSPVALVPRVALQPLTVSGHRLQPGARVHLSLAAANRDPARFRDPERFEITRPQRGALAFGYGIRGCVAAGLARAYAATAAQSLLHRAPDIALDSEGSVSWRAIPGIRALKRMDVRVRGAPGEPAVPQPAP